jgi:cholesterol 25-hydroxylase
MQPRPPSVLIPRLFLLAVGTGILCPSWWQPFMSNLYRFLYHSPIYNLSFFETVETVACYITIEPIYTRRFARNPDRRIDIRGKHDTERPPPLPKMKRPKHRLRELIIYAAPLLLLDLTLIKKYAGVDVETIRQTGGYSPYGAPLGGISPSFLAPTLHNFSLQSPVQLTRALPREVPSSRRVLIELAVSLVLYDALFFFIHIAFHRIPLLHRIHGPHHGHQEIHPQVTNRLSVTERVALILLANFSLNIIGSHALTRTLFVPLFIYLLIEVHSGVELDWQYDKILPSGWGAGTVKHAAHHREGRRYFQPFFCWWDNWLEVVEGKGKSRSRAYLAKKQRIIR